MYLLWNEVGKAQYTLIPDENGGAIDDAYLYRVGEGEYMLVVNAANREKDWQWLDQFRPKFPNIVFTDKSEDLAMMALQGPKAALILEEILRLNGNSGRLPEPFKNMLSFVRINGSAVIVARTGYTGEPVGFELFSERSNALSLWEQVLDRGQGHGVVPVGLGARDTLRLESGLPLYGHELGEDPNGDPISDLCAFAGQKIHEFCGGQRRLYRKRRINRAEQGSRRKVEGRGEVRQAFPRESCAQVCSADRDTEWGPDRAGNQFCKARGRGLPG